MDKLFDLRTELPPWMIIPATLILALLLAWPTLRDIWQVAIPRHRAHTMERRRLELLKLTLEVEALRKQHRLEHVAIEVRSSDRQAIIDTVPRYQRIIYSALGGAVSIAMIDVISIAAAVARYPAAQIDLSDIRWYVNTATTMAVFGLLGGLLALATKPRTRWSAFCFGSGPPLVGKLVAKLVGG